MPLISLPVIRSVDLSVLTGTVARIGRVCRSEL